MILGYPGILGDLIGDDTQIEALKAGTRARARNYGKRSFGNSEKKA